MTPHPNPPSLERAAQRVLIDLAPRIDVGVDGEDWDHICVLCGNSHSDGPDHVDHDDAEACSVLKAALTAHREQRKRIVAALKDLTVLAADFVVFAAMRDLDRRATALLSELEAEGSAEG